MIGPTDGTLAHGMVGVITSDNVAKQDTVFIASPWKPAQLGLNYVGVVFENNLSRNSEVGIKLGKDVEATLRRNRFVNVATPIQDGGTEHIRQLDD